MDKQNAQNRKNTTHENCGHSQDAQNKLKLKNKIKTIKTLKIEKIKITATNC